MPEEQELSMVCRGQPHSVSNALHGEGHVGLRQLLNGAHGALALRHNDQPRVPVLRINHRNNLGPIALLNDKRNTLRSGSYQVPILINQRNTRESERRNTYG